MSTSMHLQIETDESIGFNLTRLLIKLIINSVNRQIEYGSDLVV